jgi:hypothetical protein
LSNRPADGEVFANPFYGPPALLVIERKNKQPSDRQDDQQRVITAKVIVPPFTSISGFAGRN